MNLSMRGIVKSFGANDVLKSVDFSLKGGEVCALLGENGAGKSTLMNILGGVLQADAGTIELDGQSVQFHTPHQSLEAGIAFIHQELNLINDLPVYENMFIGRELKKKSGLLDHKEMIRSAFYFVELSFFPFFDISPSIFPGIRIFFSAAFSGLAAANGSLFRGNINTCHLQKGNQLTYY